MATPTRYAPPSGYSLTISCTPGRYTAPGGYALAIECNLAATSRVLGATILTPIVLGVPSIRLLSQRVTLGEGTGIAAGAPGRPTVRSGNVTLYASPLINLATFGQHQVYNAAKGVTPSGFDASAYGNRAIIANAQSFITVQGWNNARVRPDPAYPSGAKQQTFETDQQLGRPILTHFVQFFYGISAGELTLWGETRVHSRRARAENELQPYGAEDSVVSNKHRVFIRYEVVVGPGEAHSEVGYPWFHLNGQLLPLSGVQPGEVGSDASVVAGPPPQYLLAQSPTFSSAFGNAWAHISGPQELRVEGIDPPEQAGRHYIDGKAPRTYVQAFGWDSLTPYFHRTVVRNRSEKVDGVGFGFADSFVSDQAKVFLGQRYIYPEAFADAVIGWAQQVKLAWQTARPEGIPPRPPSVGHRLQLFHSFISGAGGVDSTFRAGRHTIELRTKSIQAIGWLNDSTVGAHHVAGEVQRVKTVGWVSGAVTQGSYIFKPGSIEPVGVESSNIFGLHRIFLPKVVRPSGWLEEQFGGFQSLLGHQIIQLGLPTAPTKYGLPVVTHPTQFVRHEGWGYDSTVIGRPVVWNRRQYVEPSTHYYPEFTSYGEPDVRNRNRQVHPFGWAPTRIGYHDVRAGAKAVDAEGIAPEEITGVGIGHRVRYVTPVGWLNDSKINHWAHIRNTGRGLKAEGQVLSVFGQCTVQRGQQFVKWVSWDNEQQWGLPWISHGSRTVRAWDVQPTTKVSEAAIIRWNPFPLQPTSWESSHVYVPFVREQFTRIGPKGWADTRFSAELAVRNRNREVGPEGTYMTRYGEEHVVFHGRRYLRPTGWLDSVVGFRGLDVQHRHRTVHPFMFQSSKVSTLHRLTQLRPRGPYTQHIDLFRLNQDGGLEPVGYGWDSSEVGRPLLPLQTIHAFGEDSLVFGSTRLFQFWIRPQPIYEDTVYGRPTLERFQIIRPKSITNGAYPPSGVSAVGRPRLSPNYIYAPSGDAWPFPTVHHDPTPLVGVENETRSDDPPGRGWDGQSSHPWFGLADVQHRHRRVYAPGVDGQSNELLWATYKNFGRPEIFNARLVIAPWSWKSSELGFPIFLDVPQHISLDDPDLGGDGIENQQVFGEADISFPPPPYDPNVRPQGEDIFKAGDHEVQLRNRVVAPLGIAHTGNPQLKEYNPWGVPTMGWRRWFDFQGADMLEMGRAWVSNKIRYVYPAGWINCSLEDDNFDDFIQPMRVWKASRYQRQRVEVPSLPDTQFGRLLVTDQKRVVYAYSAELPTVPNVKVQHVNVVAPIGFASTVFGDIQRWEAGKIKPYPIDGFAAGAARMGRSVQVIGCLSEVTGEPRLGAHVQVIGHQSSVIDRQVVSNPFNCDLLVLPAESFISDAYGRAFIRNRNP